MQVLEEALVIAQERIEEISNKAGFHGIPSGFDRLDKLTCGWTKGDLVSIGARPGMGKTSFALSMAKNISVCSRIPLAYFSIETDSANLIQKLISLETGLSLNKLNSGRLEKYEWELFNVKLATLKNAPLYIDDTPGLSIEQFESKVNDLVSNQKIRIVIIDYLQLMTISDKNSIAANREQHISIVINKLKYVARTYGIVVVVLSQLSRAIETRGGSKRPILSDFRESGAIENDSDLVGMIYRPEYYKIEEWDDEERTPTQNQAEFIVAKNRKGGLDNIRLKFIGNRGKFDNLDEFDAPFDFQSKMNDDDENPFNPTSLPSADQAFGSFLNDSEDNDIPF